MQTVEYVDKKKSISESEFIKPINKYGKRTSKNIRYRNNKANGWEKKEFHFQLCSDGVSATVVYAMEGEAKSDAGKKKLLTVGVCV